MTFSWPGTVVTRAFLLKHLTLPAGNGMAFSPPRTRTRAEDCSRSQVDGRQGWEDTSLYEGLTQLYAGCFHHDPIFLFAGIRHLALHHIRAEGASFLEGMVELMHRTHVNAT